MTDNVNNYNGMYDHTYVSKPNMDLVPQTQVSDDMSRLSMSPKAKGRLKI